MEFLNFLVTAEPGVVRFVVVLALLGNFGLVWAFYRQFVRLTITFEARFERLADSFDTLMLKVVERDTVMTVWKSAHDKQDDERYESLSEALREIRRDQHRQANVGER